MIICGLLKTTLLDYPGHVAATVFTGGCNMHCPFCHNSDLINIADFPEDQKFSEEEVLAFIKKRSFALEGICITGGEPTLQADLADFICKVREFGLKIKLDTNGSRPEVIKQLHEQGLIDYVAMDIKAGRGNYANVAGVDDCSPILERVKESVAYLNSCGIEHEFRTTAVRGLHTAADFEDIAEWLAGSPSYFIQDFKDSEQVVYSGFEPFTRAELETFKSIVDKSIDRVEIRGVD